MQRNLTQWTSIAKFLEKDPLVALGLAGGWARGEGEARPRPATEPEFITPPSNTGVNKVGEVVRVERDQRPECFRCVVVHGDRVVVDQCESCK